MASFSIHLPVMTCHNSFNTQDSNSQSRCPNSSAFSNHQVSISNSPGRSRKLLRPLSLGRQESNKFVLSDLLFHSLRRDTCDLHPSSPRPSRALRPSARLETEVPLAAAIGVSILTSALPLVLPSIRSKKKSSGKDDKKESGDSFGLGEIQSGAMAILGVVPLFNWMAWILPFLDTREPRYLAYAAIYAAPYLTTGLSLSLEDSWLPLASIVLCSIHIQVENYVADNDPAETLSLPTPTWQERQPEKVVRQEEEGGSQLVTEEEAKDANKIAASWQAPSSPNPLSSSTASPSNQGGWEEKARANTKAGGDGKGNLSSVLDNDDDERLVRSEMQAWDERFQASGNDGRLDNQNRELEDSEIKRSSPK
eukprot:TRINITY_DN229_c1_g1_i1.p1 TRINITY_DN229_c1_g1~~TRINITY_DN229_c1_g1_i1.p1  ORF type:complete len:366 (+),score=48.55 TRINITY_DN229_c1_g1_i1:245-1342(+)